MTRRHLLETGAKAGGAAFVASIVGFGAPAVNRSRYRLFAQSNTDYSARAVELVQGSPVIDMLFPFTLNFSQQAKWFAQPESFSAADLDKYRESGINVFHIAVGLGGPQAYENSLHYVASWNAFL